MTSYWDYRCASPIPVYTVGEQTQVLCVVGKLYPLSYISGPQLGTTKRAEYKHTEDETQLSPILLQLSCSLGALLRQILSRVELYCRLVLVTSSQALSLPGTRATCYSQPYI